MSQQPTNPSGIDLTAPEPEHTLETALARIDELRAEIAANVERGIRLATFFLNEDLSTGDPVEVITKTSEMLRDYVYEMGYAAPGAGFYINITTDSYNIDAGDAHGESDALAIERATAEVGGGFTTATVTGGDGKLYLMAPYARVGETTDIYGWLGIELLDGAEVDTTTESILLAIAMWMRQQLERAVTVAEAKHSTEIARIAAKAQMLMSQPLELADALCSVVELLHESESVTGAAAVRSDDGDTETLACWGEIDSARAIALATGAASDTRRTVVLPVTVDGVEEATMVVHGLAGGAELSDEMLATVAGSVGSSVARHRAAETIESLRRSATRQLIEAQERERSMIAADVHDGVLQQLGATAIRLELAQAQVERSDFDSARKIIEDGAGEIRSCARELRALLMELRPQVLDDNGLSAAVKELAHHLPEVEIDVATSVPDDLGNEYSITIFRIVQEALTNIQKHAHAAHASVDVHMRDECVEIEIADDGVGYEAAVTGPSAEGSHLGLLGMRERAGMLGGTFSIEGRSGSGTRIIARLPLKNGGPPPGDGDSE